MASFLPRVYAGKSCANRAQHVFGVRYNGQMIRIYAAWNIASVMNFFTVGYGPVKEIISRFVRVSASATIIYLPVSCIQNGRRPKPTPAIGFGRILRRKALKESMIHHARRALKARRRTYDRAKLETVKMHVNAKF